MASIPPQLREAMNLLRGGHAGKALPLLEEAIRDQRSLLPAHTLHLECLISLGQLGAARSALDRNLTLSLDTADAYDALAFFARQLDRHELSRQLYAEAAKRAPSDTQIWYNLATSERSLGHLSQAQLACNHALNLDPNNRPALLLRSEIGRASDASNNIDDLTGRISANASGPDAMYLYYALGKELHELGRYDEAFDAFARGAKARRESLHYDVSQDERKLQRIIDVFSTGLAPKAGADTGQHIFIVGLPRSGTTLTERIIGGLRGVRSNNETNNFSTALLRAAPPGNEDVFGRAARADSRAVAREYEALANSDGFTGKIIEKLPFNYLYIGAILRAFPDTPVIWVRRDPVDSCFAMFRTLFGAAYPFSYDFADLARYYAAYDKLMKHWMTIFPGRLTSVEYEELVQAPGSVSPRLAGACGLEWSADALDISKNQSASLTASAAQVRGAIYTTSAGMWQKYKSHLDPLARLLKDHGVKLPAD